MGVDVVPVAKLEAMLAGVTDRWVDSIFRDPFKYPMGRYTADRWTLNKALVQWSYPMGPVYHSVPPSLPTSLHRSVSPR